MIETLTISTELCASVGVTLPGVTNSSANATVSASAQPASFTGMAVKVEVLGMESWVGWGVVFTGLGLTFGLGF